MITLIPSVEWLSRKYSLQHDQAMIIRKYAIAAEKRICVLHGRAYTGCDTIAPLIVSRQADVKPLFNRDHELHSQIYVIVQGGDELIGFWDMKECKAVFFDNTLHTISMMNMLQTVVTRIIELLDDTDRPVVYPYH